MEPDQDVVKGAACSPAGERSGETSPGAVTGRNKTVSCLYAELRLPSKLGSFYMCKRNNRTLETCVPLVGAPRGRIMTCTELLFPIQRPSDLPGERPTLSEGGEICPKAFKEALKNEERASFFLQEASTAA